MRMPRPLFKLQSRLAYPLQEIASKLKFVFYLIHHYLLQKLKQARQLFHYVRI